MNVDRISAGVEGPLASRRHSVTKGGGVRVRENTVYDQDSQKTNPLLQPPTGSSPNKELRWLTHVVRQPITARLLASQAEGKVLLG